MLGHSTHKTGAKPYMGCEGEPRLNFLAFFVFFIALLHRISAIAFKLVYKSNIKAKMQQIRKFV